VHFVTALRAFGHPYCQLDLHCVWVPLLPTHLALTLVRLLMRFVTSFHAFGHPSCELALPCIRAPNLGGAILKNLPPSQNCFLSIIRLLFFPSAPFCGHFRCGSSCVSLQLFMCLDAHLSNWPCIASGCPCFQLNLPCPWSPTLARLLVCFVTAIRAFGHPCCELALRCVRAPIL
jgi:hypothetical protein